MGHFRDCAAIIASQIWQVANGRLPHLGQCGARFDIRVLQNGQAMSLPLDSRCSPGLDAYLELEPDPEPEPDFELELDRELGREPEVERSGRDLLDREGFFERLFLRSDGLAMGFRPAEGATPARSRATLAPGISGPSRQNSNPHTQWLVPPGTTFPQFGQGLATGGLLPRTQLERPVALPSARRIGAIRSSLNHPNRYARGSSEDSGL